MCHKCNNLPVSPDEIDLEKLYWVNHKRVFKEMCGGDDSWDSFLTSWECGGVVAGCITCVCLSRHILDKKHHISVLIVMDAHRCVP